MKEKELRKRMDGHFKNIENSFDPMLASGLAGFYKDVFESLLQIVKMINRNHREVMEALSKK